MLVGLAKDELLAGRPAEGHWPRHFESYPKAAQPISSAEVLSHFGEEVGTGSDSDRITVPAISIFAVSCDPVVTAPGTDPKTVVPQLRHHPKGY